MSSLIDRFKNSWNAFLGRDPTQPRYTYSYSTAYRPDRPKLTRGNYKSIVSTVYNQIAVDVSMINIMHVRLDENDKFKETINSSLNYAFTKSANVDQTGRELIRDVVISLLDEGVVAIVPVVTTVNPNNTDSYDVIEARTGKIIEWYPKHVKVEVYNEETGKKEQMVLQKRIVAIIENPFYTIMNEPNSTAQRLTRILNQIDRTNEQNSSGKLDMIIQLPYAIRSDTKRREAEKRRNDIVDQLTNSQYGIAYTDATEKVVQLNRSLDNNLWQQAKDLLADFYNQLGFSESIFNGTANEETMLNYQNRTLEPILVAITEEIERKWLSKTAVAQKQAIKFFKDPFKLVPVSQIAEISDKFTRNEIMSSNEIRSIIGMLPSKDPKADELINSNLNQAKQETVTEDIKVDE